MLIEEHDQANLFISRLLEDKAALGRGEQTKMKREEREEDVLRSTSKVQLCNLHLTRFGHF
jgi:hypothetical protein